MIESPLRGGQSGLWVTTVSEKVGEALVRKDEEEEGTFPMRILSSSTVAATD